MKELLTRAFLYILIALLVIYFKVEKSVEKADNALLGSGPPKGFWYPRYYPNIVLSDERNKLIKLYGIQQPNRLGVVKLVDKYGNIVRNRGSTNKLRLLSRLRLKDNDYLHKSQVIFYAK
jgi:hypothetical protein